VPPSCALSLTFSQDVAGKTRLSVTYRFRSGSADLDTKAYQDIARLARYLQGNADVRDVLLAGWVARRTAVSRSGSDDGSPLRVGVRAG
jgi:hypothetical protein